MNKTDGRKRLWIAALVLGLVTLAVPPALAQEPENLIVNWSFEDGFYPYPMGGGVANSWVAFIEEAIPGAPPPRPQTRPSLLRPHPCRLS